MCVVCVLCGLVRLVLPFYLTKRETSYKEENSILPHRLDSSFAAHCRPSVRKSILATSAFPVTDRVYWASCDAGDALRRFCVNPELILAQ